MKKENQSQIAVKCRWLQLWWTARAAGADRLKWSRCLNVYKTSQNPQKTTIWTILRLCWILLLFLLFLSVYINSNRSLYVRLWGGGGGLVQQASALIQHPSVFQQQAWSTGRTHGVRPEQQVVNTGPQHGGGSPVCNRLYFTCSDVLLAQYRINSWLITSVINTLS